MDAEPNPGSNRRRVAVVGPCASGKSTLAAALRRHGFDAYACGQEHSEIASLWRHLDPDVVVALDVDLETVRRRRGSDWPETIFREQLRRLALARNAADLVLDTTVLDETATQQAVLAYLAGCTSPDHGRGPASPSASDQRAADW
jgi:nicotinamide riboside kinase